MWTKVLVLGLVSLMGIRSCGDSLPDLPEGVFVLKVDEVYEADGFALQLNAIQDSRCPKGVECVWAGNARVALALKGAQPDTLTFCLGACSVNGLISDTIYQGNNIWLLTLLEANPYPVYQKKQSEKEAKFKLEEL